MKQPVILQVSNHQDVQAINLNIILLVSWLSIFRLTWVKDQTPRAINTIPTINSPMLLDLMAKPFLFPMILQAALAANLIASESHAAFIIILTTKLQACSAP